MIKVFVVFFGLLLTCLVVKAQQDTLALPIAYINNIQVVDDMSFIEKLGWTEPPTTREVDEAYGVDSIYYYQLDSFILTYLVQNHDRKLAGINLKCDQCLGLSKGGNTTIGAAITDLIQTYPKLFSDTNPSLNIPEARTEDILKWEAISLKIHKHTNFVSIYDFGLVNFSLKEGVITHIDIQYFLE